MANRPVLPVTLSGTFADDGTIIVSGPGQKWRAKTWKRVERSLASSSAMNVLLISIGRNDGSRGPWRRIRAHGMQI